MGVLEKNMCILNFKKLIDGDKDKYEVLELRYIMGRCFRYYGVDLVKKLVFTL
jgi:hypothetical protein